MKVASDVLRVYKTLHTWVGITSGLLLFIGFFAGALTMFKQPLDGWARSPQERLPAVAHDQLDTLVEQVLATYPDARHGFKLALTDELQVMAPLVWEAHEEGEEAGHGPDLTGHRWLAGLDGQGQLVAREIQPSMLGELIDMLHRTAGVPGQWGGEYIGIYLMGVAGALYALALISGLILLLPTLVKDFFVLRPGKNRKRFWLDAHNVIGITSLPFHLVIAFTVVVFAFHDQFYDALGELVYGDTPMFGGRPGVKPVVHDFSELRPASELLATIQTAAADFQVKELVYMGLDGPRPLVRAAIYHPDYLVRGPYTAYVGVNPYSGALTMTGMLPGMSNDWSDIVMTFFALHFGSFAGLPVRWTYFLLGLSGAFLFYSGNLLWIESRRKKQKRGQPCPVQARNTRWMAAATVGISLGSVGAVALTIASAKWAALMSVSDINGWYLTLYYSLFVAAVLLAFWRGAAAGAVTLLKACALACWSIPLSTLLGALMPESGLWAYTQLSALMVDITAGVLGAGFWWASRRTLRRLQQAAADTVWTLNAPAEQTRPAVQPAG
ncbi:PepSY-associated TM helix domain-containing protein [Thalassolituus sp. LLYu03]|uniref:PepSY-associated TM helix domain-containing protein n=1 Tax=Thalassolituus sp. LLYu03 TaxID=3421656 RepID=UPI003D29EA1A